MSDNEMWRLVFIVLALTSCGGQGMPAGIVSTLELDVAAGAKVRRGGYHLTTTLGDPPARVKLHWDTATAGDAVFVSQLRLESLQATEKTRVTMDGKPVPSWVRNGGRRHQRLLLMLRWISGKGRDGRRGTATVLLEANGKHRITGRS